MKRTLAGLVFGAALLAQQQADPNFDARVARPAYAKNGPKVLFDEAHFNFHTCGERYKPFCDLIANDGYRVSPNKEKFDAKTLAGYDLLVISNALGAAAMGSPQARQPAFAEAECDAVAKWVGNGGALLLIADHAPMGEAAENLGKRFGVDMSKGWTVDNDSTTLTFSRENKLLADHAITQGRDASERINQVRTFTGQSLKGPQGSAVLLALADTAIDILPGKTQRSAAGRAQGIALTFGKGRVVLMGEAAMMTAQLSPGQDGKPQPWGMQLPGLDNRQLALNIMHWLSGLLK
jgi:hypothetical protein